MWMRGGVCECPCRNAIARAGVLKLGHVIYRISVLLKEFQAVFEATTLTVPLHLQCYNLPRESVISLRAYILNRVIGGAEDGSNLQLAHQGISEALGLDDFGSAAAPQTFTEILKEQKSIIYWPKSTTIPNTTIWLSWRLSVSPKPFVKTRLWAIGNKLPAGPLKAVFLAFLKPSIANKQNLLSNWLKSIAKEEFVVILFESLEARSIVNSEWCGEFKELLNQLYFDWEYYHDKVALPPAPSIIWSSENDGRVWKALSPYYLSRRCHC